jgi:hypothetical protein
MDTQRFLFRSGSIFIAIQLEILFDPEGIAFLS